VDDSSKAGDQEAHRITIRLSPEAKKALEEIVELGHMASIQEAVRRAIGDELYFIKERRDGWKVLLQKGNKYREVVWTSL
jgi:Arc/MetJ-type ribon-helix-helix transcriptional regulator